MRSFNEFLEQKYSVGFQEVRGYSGFNLSADEAIPIEIHDITDLKVFYDQTMEKSEITKEDVVKFLDGFIVCAPKVDTNIFTPSTRTVENI